MSSIRCPAGTVTGLRTALSAAVADVLKPAPNVALMAAGSAAYRARGTSLPLTRISERPAAFAGVAGVPGPLVQRSPVHDWYTTGGVLAGTAVPGRTSAL